MEVIVGNAPGVGTLTFTSLTYNVYLAENARKGTPVVQVKAKFVTGGPGLIAYSFASGNEDLTFNIDPDTGTVELGQGTGNIICPKHVIQQKFSYWNKIPYNVTKQHA